MKGVLCIPLNTYPWKMTTAISFSEKQKAFAFEKYFKSHSGRAFSKKTFLIITLTKVSWAARASRSQREDWRFDSPQFHNFHFLKKYLVNVGELPLPSSLIINTESLKNVIPSGCR